MTLFLLGLLLSVPLAIAANLLTPWVSTTLAQRSAKRRQQRIRTILKEYRQVTAYRNGTGNAWAARIAAEMVSSVLSLAVAVIFWAPAVARFKPDPFAPYHVTWWNWTGFAVLAWASFACFRTMSMCARVYSPRWYERRTARQLRRLGAPPADSPGTA